jgi:trk system potassium uptake protein TrkA
MKFCVIGLGRLGYQLAVSLSENGMDVMGVDARESIIASIRDQITQAVCIEIVDEASLRSIGVDEMDVVVVSMGEDFAQSILITALLKKQLKVPRVIARAIHEVHKDILTLIGADQVVLPEKEVGIRLADALSSPFTELFRMTDEFSISQMRTPLSFIGNTIKDLKLFEEYNVRCLAIKKDDMIYPIDPNHIVEEGDKLIFCGTNEDLARIAKL